MRRSPHFIRYGGRCRAAAALALALAVGGSLDVSAQPVFRLQPVDFITEVGGDATFAVEIANVTGALHLQWRHNGVNVPQGTDNVLQLVNVQPAHGGTYTLVAADDTGAVVSEEARLILIFPEVDPGDNFDDRVFLQGGSGAIAGFNRDARPEALEPRPLGKFGRHSVWYGWFSPVTGIVTLSTRGSDFDTLLGVYDGRALGDLTVVAEDDDFGGSKSSLVRFYAEEGHDYAILIDGLGDDSGRFVLEWSSFKTPNPLPVIVEQPLSQTVRLDAEVEFSVKVTGQILSFQWYHNGGRIVGAVGDRLVIERVQPENVGVYYVSAFDENQQVVFSQFAVLEIGPDPGVRSLDKIGDLYGIAPPQRGPGGGGGSAGGSASMTRSLIEPTGTFSVGVGSIIHHTLDNTAATGDSAVAPHCGIVGGADKWLVVDVVENGLCQIDTVGSGIDTVVSVYQWTGSILTMLTSPVTCNNDINPPGNLQSLVQFAAQAGDRYYVALDGRLEAKGPIQFNLQFGLAPVTTLPPPGPYLYARKGDTVTLPSGFAPNPFPLTFQWKQNSVNLPATGSALTLSNLQLADQGVYTVTGSNWAGSAVNTVARLIVDTLEMSHYQYGRGGMFGFTLTGDPEQRFIIEGSEDFDTWVLLLKGKLTVAEPFVEFIDADSAVLPKRFYRARPDVP